MTIRWHLRWLTGLALLVASLGLNPASAQAADGEVGGGTSDSCSETAFNAVLSTVQASGGGMITFNCGPAPHTILFTAPKAINSSVSIDGAGQITFSGGSTTSLFAVNFSGSLSLRGLTLVGARGPGAAIGNFGRLEVIDSQLMGNTATNGPGGAISSIGTAVLTNTRVISNTASQNGGGLYNGGSMTISGGLVSDNSVTELGGGIYNAGTLIISGGQITGNRATMDGGGVYTIGAITITQSSLTNNVATGSGGGLYGDGANTRISASVVRANSGSSGGGIAHFRGTLALDQVYVVDNQARLSLGGGVLVQGSGGVFNFSAVTIFRNRALQGGGISMANGSLTLVNSTVGENRAQTGGGLDLFGGRTSIQHVTIVNNIADSLDPALAPGAGIFGSSSTLELRSSLLSGNRRFTNGSSANCDRAVTSTAAQINLSSDGTCGFGAGRDNVALPLGPLQSNDGYTPTYLLPQGSPAIDVDTSPSCPPVDQRGQTRPVGAACDVGAVEARSTDFVFPLYLPALQK